MILNEDHYNSHLLLARESIWMAKRLVADDDDLCAKLGEAYDAVAALVKEEA